MFNTTRLPNPHESFYFRSNYGGAEALHSARKAVEELYPNRPIETKVHGDYRAKDTFSLRCVDIESELEKGTPAKDVLSIVKQWAPVKRTDLHVDNIASGTIEYNEHDPDFFQILIQGDKQQGLTVKGVKRALHQLTKNGLPQANRVPLSAAMKAALGPLEQMDVFEPLPENKKTKAPRVVSAANIMHYGDLMQQNQFAQNLQDTCAEGSRLVVGPSESNLSQNVKKLSPLAALFWPADYLPALLSRHGFFPDREANAKIKEQRVSNALLRQAEKDYQATPEEQVVFIKTEL